MVTNASRISKEARSMVSESISEIKMKFDARDEENININLNNVSQIPSGVSGSSWDREASKIRRMSADSTDLFYQEQDRLDVTRIKRVVEITYHRLYEFGKLFEFN